jgi:hypothetical protein
MQSLVQLLCGAGFVVDWNAVSAIATTAAVLVALWLPTRDRRQRRLERLESEARAAEIIEQKLGGIIEILPLIGAVIEKSDGTLIDNPGTDVIYGIDACRSLLERETFCHQLPITFVGRAELVCALARKWCADIDVRLQVQRDPKLKAMVNWRKHESLRSIGQLLHSEAVHLRSDCSSTKLNYEHTKAPLYQRALAAMKLRGG